MYEVIQKFQIANKYCIFVKGNPEFLKKEMQLEDEKGNIFIIESIGMVHYKNIGDYQKYAELLLIGNIENIGKNLIIK